MLVLFLAIKSQEKEQTYLNTEIIIQLSPRPSSPIHFAFASTNHRAPEHLENARSLILCVQMPFLTFYA